MLPTGIPVAELDTLGPWEITKVLSQSRDQPQLNIRRPLTGYRRGSVARDSVADFAVGSMSAKAKPGQLLHLPSFSAFVNTVPQLDSLLTPPNEDGHDLALSPSRPKHLSFPSTLRCSSYLTTSLSTDCSRVEEPVSSFPEAPDLQVMQGTPSFVNLSARVSEADSYFTTGGGISTLEEMPEDENHPAPEEQSTTSQDRPVWLQQALRIAGKLVLVDCFQRTLG